MMTKTELACVYSALVLVDDDIAVTGEKIQTILKAAGVEVEPYWPGLFAKSLEGVNIKEMITRLGSGVGAAPVGGGAPVAAAAAAAASEAPAAKEEKKKEEPEEESDDDMGFGLFD